jgi:DNA-binding GntR family transcriptional regulator/DNA-binding LacI/PurR family transcriptional regulator
MNKQQKSSPAVRKAARFILELALEGKLKPGQQLAQLSELAGEAKTSIVTMSKACRLLKQRDVLSGVSGRRFRAADRSSQDLRALSDELGQQDIAPVRTSKKWERLRENLEQDLLNGAYPPGEPLPSLKEMRYRYGASYPTLVKVLGALCKHGLIEETNRGYRAASLIASPRSGKIILLGNRTDVDHRLKLDVGADDFLRTLQFECSRTGLKLESIVYGEEGGVTHYWPEYSTAAIDFKQQEDIFGYIMVILHGEVDRAEPVLRDLAHFQRPVAILTSDRSFTLPSYLRRPRQFQIFHIGAAEKHATTVARFMLQLGHHRIAFISPFHGALWSRERLAGMQSTYETAGFADGVQAFTLDSFINRMSFRNDAYEHWYSSEIKDACKTINKRIGIVSMRIASQEAHGADDFVKFAMVYKEIQKQLGKLFARAYKDSSITAWIAANDLVASYAVDYIVENKIACPQKLSLISFDDSVASQRNGITSYNFNIPNTARSMLSFVLKTGYFAVKRSGRPIELDGLVVVRTTTAMARKQ